MPITMRGRYEIIPTSGILCGKIHDESSSPFSSLPFRNSRPKFYVFRRPCPVIDLSIYPLHCHPPAASIPREILNSACSDERENGRDRIAETKNKARTKRRSVFGFVACILINRIDIAARNLVLPRDDDTPVPEVTIVAKTARPAKLNCRYFVCQS